MTHPGQRVLVVGGRFGPLTPTEAGRAVGAAFAERAQVAVVGLAAGGPDLGRCLADLRGGRFVTVPGGWASRGPGWLAVGLDPTAPLIGLDPTASSEALGRVLAAALDEGPVAEIVVDLTGLACHDAGAGLLAALGAAADRDLAGGATPLRGIAHVDLEPVRRRLDGGRLVGVVPAAESNDLLLGLRGVTARRGHPAGADPALMLATDAALADFAAACAPEAAAAPGAGAAGGAGFAVLALGGTLTTGTALGAEAVDLPRTMRQADVVVATCDALDVGNRGGEVIGELARRAEDAERPLVVLAAAVGISGRELRTLGVESAHEVGVATGDPAAALRASAQRIATFWLRAAAP